MSPRFVADILLLGAALLISTEQSVPHLAAATGAALSWWVLYLYWFNEARGLSESWYLCGCTCKITPAASWIPRSVTSTVGRPVATPLAGRFWA